MKVWEGQASGRERVNLRRVKPLKDISVTQRGWTLDVLNIVLGSATVPVAVCNVPLRTFPKRIRRDAGRRVRDARAPHFTPDKRYRGRPLTSGTTP
jgi:hypothetical protein